jgi:hypothetical protein
MSLRYKGGVISATPPTTSTTSAVGVWTLAQQLQAQGAGNWPTILSDQYFRYVTMLLHGDGTNGAQNNTFLDSSTNNFTITRNGNTTQGSFSPYGSNWSNYFDGSTAWFSVASNAAFGMGTGDCTLECWYFPINSTVGVQTLIDIRTTNTGVPVVIGVLSTGIPYAYNGTIYSGGTVTNNAWNHIAFVRNGSGSNNCKLYLNGLQVAQFTDANDWGASDSCAIGRNTAFNGEFAYGYISNARVVKGTAVYTSAFTPSTTPLTAISGTSLLTCQSNRFIDNSTNNFAITRNGTPSVQRFSPFSPTAAYSTSVIGGSGYFDGASSNLVTANTVTTVGTQDFCLEAWVYCTSTTSYACIVGSDGAGPSTGFFIEMGTARGIWLGGPEVSMGSAIYNQWVHLVFCRVSGTYAGYINGVRLATGTFATNLSTATKIGVNNYAVGSVSGYGTTGYIADARVFVGSSPYSPSSTTITVPTAPLTAAANTLLLFSATNAGVLDNAMMNNLQTVGNAQISTSVVKFGTGSMAFDGNGDYLSIPSSANLNMGSGDWTFECWVYISTRTLSYPLIFGNNNGSYSSGALAITNSNADTPSYYDKFFLASYDTGTPTLISSATNSLNTWYHLAIVRNGTSLVMYRNGVSVASTTISAGAVFNWGKNGSLIGGGNWDGANSYFNGYIDDLRITKGYARYTSNFTPPTAAFPNQ